MDKANVYFITHWHVSALAGCPCINCICLTPEATVQATAFGKQIFLRYLDMTDCFALDDAGLQIIASYCSQLVHLYLRRCSRVTDIGVQYVANYCSQLREFSISDCKKVTDFGMRELSKLEGNLRYLSVAKCDQVSDVGIKYIARYCHKLRYLNVRSCEGVSDDSIEMVAKNCKRLKSLDIGKCDVTDDVLAVIATHCPQLRKLSVKSCDAITDAGIIAVANHCPQLQQLNIQDCQISVEAYRMVKKSCKRCIIEHTNPGFYWMTSWPRFQDCLSGFPLPCPHPQDDLVGVFNPNWFNPERQQWQKHFFRSHDQGVTSSSQFPVPAQEKSIRRMRKQFSPTDNVTLVYPNFWRLFGWDFLSCDWLHGARKEKRENDFPLY